VLITYKLIERKTNIMRKIVLFISISLFTATSVFAAGSSLTLSLSTTGLSLYGAKSGTATNASPLIGKTSTGVGVGIIVDATAGSGYSLMTQHKNGTKVFGSSFDSTSIFSKEVTAGTADTTTLTTGASQFSGSWTTM
jgi:hypothetical protein